MTRSMVSSDLSQKATQDSLLPPEPKTPIRTLLIQERASWGVRPQTGVSCPVNFTFQDTRVSCFAMALYVREVVVYPCIFSAAPWLLGSLFAL